MEDTLKPDANKLNYLVGFLKRKKLLFGIILIVIAALAGYFIVKSHKNVSGNYLTDTVKKGTVTTTISASGTIEPVSTVSLSFKNSEIIKDIYVKVGDHVTAGQLLAEQYTDNLDASVIQATASLKGNTAKLQLLQNGSTQEDLDKAATDVKMAQASYDLAKTTLDRYQQLYEGGAISKADLDKYNSDLINAEGKLKQAENSLKSLQAGNRPEDIEAAAAQVDSSSAQLKLAQNDLAGAKMYCSIDGIVSEINGAVGQRATANNNSTSGGGFMTVISEALQLKSQVNEADIGKAAVGQTVEFTLNSYPNKTFTGKVSSIAPQATTVSNVQLYDVYIQPDQNYVEMKAGMPTNVTIIIDRHENTLTIPKGAVSYAASYLSKMRQAGAPVTEGTGGANGTGGIQRQNRQSAGAGSNASNNNGSNNTDASSSPASYQEQQATVLVMNGSGTPSPKRVVLGLSDLSNYEVVNGLNEGDTIVIGSLDQSAATNTQGNQSSQRSNNPMTMGAPRVQVTGGGARRN
ncbi:efflux RND transporter periplasmic adaptor subunit [Pelotomaculum isophthalicicum JI]|uniref:Efflux RND transporter periplasmic adaptor subunit n=1 Tax=Pelotomaculum isophthalicicum JI TaxID=947010 RepID=A0A9X4JSN8_9FIRM|nr:efflux RND transporter periplasmic adaptor subunit [Pelotomaculum isophthalicicum]MDF9406969.1 efflux RND transporter periplasmic adaptor subunit [Pelotomaculum isophthalicicum JI]